MAASAFSDSKTEAHSYVKIQNRKITSAGVEWLIIGSNDEGQYLNCVSMHLRLELSSNLCLLVTYISILQFLEMLELTWDSCARSIKQLATESVVQSNLNHRELCFTFLFDNKSEKWRIMKING
jgi:hypothetical protein